jgi:hypothetical protein
VIILDLQSFGILKNPERRKLDEIDLNSRRPTISQHKKKNDKDSGGCEKSFEPCQYTKYEELKMQNVIF